MWARRRVVLVVLGATVASSFLGTGPAMAEPAAARGAPLVLAAREVSLLGPAGLPVTRRVALLNVGDAPTRILDVVDPPVADGIAITDECNGRKLMPGRSCDVIVSPAPGAGPPSSATHRHFVQVDGDRLPLDVRSGAVVSVRADPTVVEFGEVPIGGRATQRVTWTNDSTVTQVPGTRPALGRELTVATDCPSTGLAPGASCHDTYVRRGIADVGETYDVVALTWNGLPTGFVLHGHTAAQIVISPAELDFGQVRVGDVSAPQRITFSNVTDSPVRIGGPGAAWHLGSDFELDADCLGVVVPGRGDCVTNLRMRPVDAFPTGGSLGGTFNGNADGVEFDGTGTTGPPVTPPLQIGATVITFGTIPLGEQRARSITLVNRSADPIVLRGGPEPSPYPYLTIGGTCHDGKTLSPGAQCRTEYTAHGTGILDPTNPPPPLLSTWNGQHFAVEARQAQQPALRVAGAPSLGGTAGIAGPAGTVTLVNDTRDTLTLDVPATAGPLPLTGTCTGVTLAPGGTCTIQVHWPAESRMT